ncbi:MAG: hypothetical protein WAU72_08300 [Acidimicrobiia bacterium]
MLDYFNDLARRIDFRPIALNGLDTEVAGRLDCETGFPFIITVPVNKACATIN